MSIHSHPSEILTNVSNNGSDEEMDPTAELAQEPLLTPDQGRSSGIPETDQQQVSGTATTNQQSSSDVATSVRFSETPTTNQQRSSDVATSVRFSGTPTTNPQRLSGAATTAQQRLSGSETTDQRHSSSTATTDRDSRSSQQKECIICRKPMDSELIQPCRCGYWAHDQCLIHVVQRFEDQNNHQIRNIGCRVCKRAYNILPANNIVVRVGTKLAEFYEDLCDVLFQFCFQIATDTASVKIGSIVLEILYGTKEAMQIVTSMSHNGACFACQMIPVASIIVCSIPWEREALKLLRRCSTLPVVGGIFPTDYQKNTDRASRDEGLNLFGGLMLPFYGLAASRLFTVVESPLAQFLLGTTSVILLNGICKMYYQQQKYVQFCTLRVLDSVPAPDPIQRTKWYQTVIL